MIICSSRDGGGAHDRGLCLEAGDCRAEVAKIFCGRGSIWSEIVGWPELPGCFKRALSCFRSLALLFYGGQITAPGGKLPFGKRRAQLVETADQLFFLHCSQELSVSFVAVRARAGIKLALLFDGFVVFSQLAVVLRSGALLGGYRLIPLSEPDSIIELGLEFMRADGLTVDPLLPAALLSGD
jgi:hypothetical protein